MNSLVKDCYNDLRSKVSYAYQGCISLQGKNGNTVKHYSNLKFVFECISKYYFIPVMAKPKFQQPLLKKHLLLLSVLKTVVLFNFVEIMNIL